MISEEQIRDALKDVKYPGFNRDIISFGLVKGIRIQGADVSVQLSLATNDPKIPAAIHENALARLRALPGIGKVDVRIDIQAAPAAAASAAGPQVIEGIDHIIAIASGKGGVGKSTVAANLAVALRRGGARVGLCDCDLYGPSIGVMFGVNERPTADDENRIIPIHRYGVELMSMGFLLDDDAPAVLRGPMVTRYTQQFLRQVAWGDLDYLVLDLPPGTGDIQLTIVQTVALAGAIIVTTPQEVALIDARKAARMFAKTNVPVLGIIENMSCFVCPSDGVTYDLFGRGGGEREAKRLGVPLLGQIPIEIALREGGDAGRPVAEFASETASGTAFARIAGMITAQLRKS
ncbi:MAG: Mrp/NBP35 family ATP-binding protein [Terrimicrobiaceae bacterium]|nr:Mrp/NBP35 family ATP-binding protein [Terrimicrobiaceae bacterium]